MEAADPNIPNPHKSFKCNLCPSKTFSLKKSLDRHLLTHGLERNHTCETCSYSTTRKDLLRKHNKRHKVKKSRLGKKKPGFLYCSICHYHTSRPGNLTRHMAAKHSKEPLVKVMCPAVTCTAMFANKHSLKRHVDRGSCTGAATLADYYTAFPDPVTVCDVDVEAVVEESDEESDEESEEEYNYDGDMQLSSSDTDLPTMLHPVSANQLQHEGKSRKLIIAMISLSQHLKICFFTLSHFSCFSLFCLILSHVVN